MKRQTLLLFLLVLALAFQPGRSSMKAAIGGQGAPLEPGRIVGTLTKSGTGDPLPDAQILITRDNTTATPGAQPAQPRGGPGGGARATNAANGLWQLAGLPVVEAGSAQDGPGQRAAAVRGGLANTQLRATTDANGQFVMENLQPGRYIVTAQLEGFFSPAPVNTQVVAAARANTTVESGRTAEINLSLIPGGAIAGRVVDPRGRPVVDTQVQAMRLMYQPDGTPGLQNYGGRPTDDRGEFRVYRLPPGQYYLVANARTVADIALLQQDQTAPVAQAARTFFPSAMSPALATPITIKGGEEFNGTTIQLRVATLAKISGRVINTIPLEALDPPAAQRGNVAARGEAAAPQVPAAFLAAAAADPSLQPLIDQLTTLQTGLQDARGKMQEAQQKVQEVQQKIQEARGLRGNVNNAQALRQLPVVQLQLFPRDRNGLVDPNSSNRSASAQLAAPNDGKFEFQNVPPGSYDLYASLPDNTAYGPQLPPSPTTAGRSFGRVQIEVGDTDVSDVTVTVHQGADIHGRLIVDGRPAPFKDAHIVLQPDDSSTRINIYQQVGRSEAKIAADGSFTFPAIPEAAYRVQVALGGPGFAQNGRGGITAQLDAATIQELQAISRSGGDLASALAEARGRAATQNQVSLANAHVVDVRQNGVTIYDTGLVVGAGGAGAIDVYVETSSGSIAGTVMGADQKPVSGASVVLVPPPHRRRNMDLYRTATSGADGKFTINALPPGDFKLFAWQTLNGQPYLNPAFLTPYEERGAAISIFAGGQLSAQVTVIVD